ncbi:MAG: formyltransferase [Betaproteobacteria bacterium]|nr:formyltransferase [Betaproteobacteria bacterium]
MTRAVVLAYHNVGARCLSTLLAHGIAIPLLLTHRDNPAENIWFDSVADLAARYDIPTITPDDPNTPEVMAQIAAAQPDFLFSFYYRHLLGPEVLALAPRGAYNLHGSLLPKYRGRVPVNWAVLHGERETGATLHEMVAKPDAGRIVAQFRVPILPDDTAFEVFNKLTVAAEITLDGALPGLVAGTAPHHIQNLTQGSYFGGRKPEDGRIDWSRSAEAIHNLIRAVAPPYPGAFFDLGGERLVVARSLRQPYRTTRPGGPGIYVDGQHILADCGEVGKGGVLRLLSLEYCGHARTSADFVARFGSGKIALQAPR